MHSGELWQEYNTTGEPIPGSGHPKEYFYDTHPSAIYGTVHVWLYRDTDHGRELLFQLRSPEVKDGDTWDISTAGHINLGESRLEAALREAREEIGATLAPEQLTFSFSYNAPNYSLHNVYLYDYTGHPDGFQLTDGEVSDLKWVPLSELDDFVRTGGVKPILASMAFYWQILRLHLDRHEN